MIYSATITVSANTAEANATNTLLSVSKGLIWRIEVEFPAGCCGLVHIQIFDGLYQLFPASPGESLRGENILAGYEDLYLKIAAPWQLKIKTWNDDETYDHTIQVRVGMASTEAFMSRYMPSITWEKFNEVLTQAALQQEEMKQAAIRELEETVIQEESE